MKKMMLFQVCLFFSISVSAQLYFFEQAEITDFLDYYSSEYGVEYINNYSDLFRKLETDTLEYILYFNYTTADLTYLFNKHLPNPDISILDNKILLGFIAYSELLKRDIKRKDIYYYSGELFRINGEPRKAIKCYTNSLNSPVIKGFTPYDYQIYGIRGEMKNYEQDYYGAIKDLTIAIETAISIEEYKNDEYFPLDMKNYLIERGKSYSILKKFNDAINDFTSSLNYCNNDCADIYFYRGLAFLSVNKKESGCLDLSKAGELGYDDAYEFIKDYCN